MGINVLSLFDGMSCGRIALERAGIEVDNYFASEVDKYAIVSNSQAYKLLGNGWTVDVIAHIFSFMKDGAEPLQRFTKDNVEEKSSLTQDDLF